MEFKIALVGERGVGKTTLIKRLQTGIFEEKYVETEGFEQTRLKFYTNIGKVYFDVRIGRSTSIHDFQGLDGVIVMQDRPLLNNGTDIVKALNDKNTPAIYCFNNKFGVDIKTDPCCISVKDGKNLMNPFLGLLRLLKKDDSIEFSVRLSKSEIHIEPYDIEKNLYKEKSRGFIVTRHPSDTEKIVVVGKLDSDNKIRELTENERTICKKADLTFPDINENISKSPTTAESDYSPKIEDISQYANNSSPEKICWCGFSGGMVRITSKFYENGAIIAQEPICSPNKVYWISVSDGIIKISYEFYKNGDIVEQ